MMSRLFTWVDGRDSPYGTPGWMPWFGGANVSPTTEGLGIVHDFLEHRRSDSGRFWQEIMAFGAMIYTRVQGGYFAHWRGQHGQLAMLGEELVELAGGSQTGLPPIPSCKHSLCRDIEGELDSMRVGWLNRIESSKDDFHWLEQEDVDRLKKATPDVLRWISEGYRQARRRYHDNNPFDLAWLFQDAETRINTNVSGQHEVGDQLRMRFDARRRIQIQIHVKTQDDPHWWREVR